MMIDYINHIISWKITMSFMSCMHHRFSHSKSPEVRCGDHPFAAGGHWLPTQGRLRQGTSWNDLKIWWISKGKGWNWCFFLCVSHYFLDIVYLQAAFDRFFLLHVPTDSIVFGFRTRIWFQGYRFHSQWILFTCVDICIQPLYGCPVVYTWAIPPLFSIHMFFLPKHVKNSTFNGKKNDHWNWGCPSAPPLFGR